jgi:hypothetical protein
VIVPLRMAFGDGLLICVFVGLFEHMRQPRFACQGAFHHCLNRGIKGGKIFPDDRHKSIFIRSWMRDLAGLKFREIAELPIFADLQYLSLAHIYKNRKRMAANEYTD